MANKPTNNEIELAWSEIEDLMDGPKISFKGVMGLPSFDKERQEIKNIKDQQDRLKPKDEISE